MSNQRGDVRIWAVGLVFCSIVLTNPTTVLAGPPEPPDITIEAIDVGPGPQPGNPSDPVVWNGQLFFSADDGGCSGLYGRELFTAGIGTGPILVKDINTQNGGNCDGVSQHLHYYAAPLNNALIFRARPLGANNTGFEPWRTQGTAGTTEIVSDIYFSSNNSNPYGMATVFDGTHVAFGATHGFFGTEPWVTDGTQAGTHNAGNIAIDDYDSDPYGFTALSSTQFVFVATDDDVIDHEPYVSNGTTSTLLKDINPEPYDSSDPQFLTTFAGRDKVVFFAFDEIAGSEPWVTDGTPGGTIRLADINPGPTSSNDDSDGDNAGFVQVGDLMFFSADDGATGRELWVTDGTPGGTHMVTEIVAGPGGGYFAHAAAFQDLLYFAAPGIGLWRSDGTPGGTAPLVEGIFPSALGELTAVGDLLYFASSDELWVSDGTVAGTVAVASFNPSYGAQALTAVNSSLLAFWAEDDTVGREMFLAYPTSLAPDTLGPSTAIGFGPTPIEALQPGALTATSSEVNTGGADIADIEYQLDGGSWTSMEPLDSAYDSPIETGLELVSFPTAGTHQACVRGRDTLTNVGDPLCMDIEVFAPDVVPPPPPIVDIVPNPVMTAMVATLTVTASDVTTGNNQIAFIEYQIDGGNWFGMSALDGFYDEPTEQARELLVFDDGGLIPVCGRALDDANNLSDPACVDLQVDAPDPTVRLRAIEVNQVIQNWRNEVPLDQMKDTVVRVFFEKADPQAANFANGFLHGSINGVPLPGSPLVTGNRANVGDDAGAFTVVDGGDSDTDPDDAIVSYRADLGNSLNYFLPATWIDQAGTVDLEFELTSPTDGVLECAEPDDSPDCIVSVSFGSAERPIIEFFSVPYDRNEIRQITVNATSGSYFFVSGNRESDPVPWNAGAGVIEDAVEDAIGGILDARDGRVVVYNGRSPSCGSTGTGVVYTIVILRGQSESLQVNDSGLGGSVSMLVCEAGGPTISPTFDDLREQARRVSDVFPSRGVDYRLRNLGGYNRAPTLLKVNNRLSKLRKIEKALGAGVPGMKSFALLLERGPTSTKAGMAWLNVSSTYSYDAEDPTDGGYSRSTGMHEGAHTYGRAHAVVFDHGLLGSIGLCGSKYNDLASPLHPFVEDTGIENPAAAAIDESLRYTWPTIGPLSSGPDDEIWGFSPRAFQNGPGFERLVVVDPRMSAELMSYCDVPGWQQDRWVSSFSYDKLRSRLGNVKRSAAKSAAGFGFGDYLLVAGSIDDVTSEIEIEPAIRVSGLDPGDDPGELHVALVDGTGAEIASRDVALLIDGNHPSLSDGVGPEPMAFNAAIPIPDGSDPAGIVVSLDSVQIAQVMASANPPTVEITSPDAADVAVNTIPVAWTASDIDGDPLSTTILYSVDLGLTWQALAVDVEGARYDVPTAFLAGSDFALIKVLVSDGFYTTEATSNPFVVDAGYPTASIEIPANGAAVASDEILHLRGDAWDPEDGLIEGLGLSWTVGDGPSFPPPFASGGEVDVIATQFTTGCQTFTLTATDSDGHTAIDSVEIDIGATGCLGLFFADGFETGDTSSWSSAIP